MKIVVRVVAVVLILSGFGTAGYLGLRFFKEKNKVAEVAQELERYKGKDFVMRQKYLEQRAIAEGLTRGKEAAESNLLGNDKRIKQLEQEMASLLAETEGLRQESKATLARLQGEIDATVAEKEILVEVVEKNKKDSLVTEAMLKKLEKEKTESLAKLTTTSARLTLCADNNIKLGEISHELADMYAKKGVVGAIFDQEKLIQYRQVQVEKLLQEYDERIDKAKFSLR